jgi:phosphopentomutase
LHWIEQQGRDSCPVLTLERSYPLKRIFLIVLDSVGIGNAPDAAAFGDAGANTLRSVYETGLLQIPNLLKAGLGYIDGMEFLNRPGKPKAAVCRLQEISAGKDTTIGHWEIAGLVSAHPLPVYPDGFPEEVLQPFREMTGRDVLCNLPYSGTDCIRDYGDAHVKTGDLIVYTSGDSVFQIAAHEDVVPLEELYGICRQARNLLQGNHGVGRVIARPFVGESGSYTRTANRHDFSLEPPAETLLDALKAASQLLIDTLVDKIILFDDKIEIFYKYTQNNNPDGSQTENHRDFCLPAGKILSATYRHIIYSADFGT